MTGTSGSAPLLDHLEELRNRLVISLIYLTVGVGIAWNYRGNILTLLKEPLQYVKSEVHLVALQLTDQFVMSFTLSFWGGLILALPFILHQVWLFVAPGLYAQERRWAVPFILGAGLSFGVGVLFCFRVILPNMVPFLLDFLGGEVTNNLGIASYVGTIVNFLLIFGLVFELPMLALVLTKIGIVNHLMLGRVRRYALVLVLIVAAVITPTVDVLNLMLVAVPMYLLYEIGIIVSRLAAPRQQAPTTALQD